MSAKPNTYEVVNSGEPTPESDKQRKKRQKKLAREARRLTEDQVAKREQTKPRHLRFDSKPPRSALAKRAINQQRDGE